MQPTLKIKRLDPELPMPSYATEGSVGLDLYAADDALIEGGDGPHVIRTGLAVEIPHGYEGQVRPRSGLSKDGIYVALGTVDSDYRGEIGVITSILDDLAYAKIQRGDRIAQLVIAPVARPEIVEVDALSETGRGSDGFGSTGR